MEPEKTAPEGSSSFTLVELVVGTAVATVVLLAAGLAVAAAFRQAIKERARIGVQRDAQLAAYWLDLSIRRGSWAYLSEDGSHGSLVIENFSDGSRREIRQDGRSLLVDVDGSEQAVCQYLTSSTFSADVYADRVLYTFEVSAHGQEHGMTCARRLMNVPYRGLWRFTEGDGEVTFDDSGYQNHASIRGATWDTGRSGAALSFSTDDYLRIPENDDLQTGQRIALGADIKLDSGPAAGPRSTLFYLGDEANQNFVHFYVRAYGKLGCASASGGTITRYHSDTVLNTGQWHSICVQIDGTVTGVVARFYLDGDRIDHVSETLAALPSVNSGDGWLGGFMGSGTEECGFLNGVLDEVKFITY
jgi:type II secretory pathway pseudopilin PulG